MHTHASDASDRLLDVSRQQPEKTDIRAVKHEVFSHLVSRSGAQDFDEALRIAHQHELTTVAFNQILFSALADDLVLGYIAGVKRTIEYFSLDATDLAPLTSAALNGIQTSLAFGRFEAAFEIQALFAIPQTHVDAQADYALNQLALKGLETPFDKRTLAHLESLLARYPFRDHESPAKTILKAMRQLIEAGKIEATKQLQDAFGFSEQDVHDTVILALLGQLRLGATQTVARIEAAFGVRAQEAQPLALATAAAEEGYSVCLKEGRDEDARLFAEQFDIQFV